jgi:hypothetical protein
VAGVEPDEETDDITAPFVVLMEMVHAVLGSEGYRRDCLRDGTISRNFGRLTSTAFNPTIIFAQPRMGLRHIKQLRGGLREKNWQAKMSVALLLPIIRLYPDLDPDK